MSAGNSRANQLRSTRPKAEGHLPGDSSVPEHRPAEGARAPAGKSTTSVRSAAAAGMTRATCSGRRTQTPRRRTPGSRTARVALGLRLAQRPARRQPVRSRQLRVSCQSLIPRQRRKVPCDASTARTAAPAMTRVFPATRSATSRPDAPALEARRARSAARRGGAWSELVPSPF